MQEKRQPVAVKDIGIAAAGETISFQPRNFEELWRFAQLIAQTDMVPAEFKGNAGKILAAVQFGHELGLRPMQALQSIAVINGRPTVWGDGALAIVRNHPACEWIKESPAHEAAKTGIGECTVKRRDQAEPITRQFSRDMAKKAGLYDRSGAKGPWATYEGRMLQMRARAWALRDSIPEALKGMAIREEAYDYETIASETEAPIAMPERASVSKDSPEPPPDDTKETDNGANKPEPKDGELPLQR